jgi:intracellular sulfur oxidation DsrE/DsrF family protein
MDTDDAQKLAIEIFEYKKKINELDKKSKELENQLKKMMEEGSICEFNAGSLNVTLKKIQESLIPDVDALKAAGVFDQYSKIKKGYTSLTIKEIKE